MPRLAALFAFAMAAGFPLQAEIHPEAGAFLFQTYPPKVYGANPQNWSVIQDARGVIYAANTDGILEFDGTYWRRIALSVRSGVRALAVDSHGTIFVGGQGIFGYLAADAHDAMQFVSLLEKVPPTDRSFSDVWDVLPTIDGVYFSSYRRLFLYTPAGTIKVFRPEDRFGRAFTYRGQLFITSSQGLLTMKAGALTGAEDGDAKVVRGTPLYATGSAPLLAAARKLYRFSSSAISPFPTAADAYFAAHGISSIRQMAAGDIAVGTKSGGLVFLTQQGEVERILHTNDGLPSDWVTAIYTDRDGGTWVATDSGLARFARHLTSFGISQGLRGNVIAIGRLGGQLYAGTSLGLFRMKTVPGAEPFFEPVPEVQDMVLDIVEHGGLQLVAGKNGIYLLDGKTVRHILNSAVVYDIAFSDRDPGVLYAAGSDGVQKLKRNGDIWTTVGNDNGGGHETRMVMEAADGRVWASAANAIRRIDFSTPIPAVESFTESNGVPSGWNNLYRFRGHIVFASETAGLLKFSEGQKRFVPDAELGGQFASGHLGVSTMREDPLHNVWLTGKGYHGILNKQGWFAQPMLQAGIDELWSIYLDADGTCWSSGDNGKLFRYQRPSFTSGTFDILVRNVIVSADNHSLFAGDGRLTRKLKLPYSQNALRFEFSAPFFEDESAVQYQVRLDGSDKAWSEWTPESRKDYTNLSEGTYVFHVRARNPHGVLSGEQLLSFAMMPPWYRAWWAYSFYVAAFLFAGWLILRWRLQALRARNKWLEQVVEERTAEVRSERDQNEALLLNILPKPVASELRNTGSVKPTAFEDVTVCFSDFVGFTLSSEKLPAQVLITSLNDYFTAFDDIIGRYGLEKLKTIGDAYMFAGGLPNASPSHAVDSVLAALEMVEVARKLARPDVGIDWSIRLGLYSGPVVAGVVGVRKFAFDIWGNTVNFAARMESAGSANRVNLSATTCARVIDFIECEPRGRVRIKEGREMEMYFAVQPRAELMEGPVVNGIPEAFRIKYERAFDKPLPSFPSLNGIHVH